MAKSLDFITALPGISPISTIAVRVAGVVGFRRDRTGAVATT